MRELLRSVYAEEEIDLLEHEIATLMERYRELVPPSTDGLTHEDVVLITYGDQVSREGEKPLLTLHTFLNEFCDGLINGVHILPFYPYTSDDGFSVTDYYAINSDLGGWTEIQGMALDYKLMIDAVINHISKSSSWFQGFLNGEETYKNYFIEADVDRDWSQVVRPRTSPLFHPFKDSTGRVRNVWTTFSEDQVDINYRNPQVFLHILDVLLFYVSKGAKMIRLDAIGFMIKEEGSKSIHLPQTHALIKVIRKVIEELASDVILITETNVPHEENISYFGNGNDEAHMVYNFSLPPLVAYSLLKGDTAAIKNWARSLDLQGDNACFFNFTASHDGIGLRPLDGILPTKEIQVLIESAEANGGLISYRSTSEGDKSPYEINCNYMSLLGGREQSDSLGMKRMILAEAVKMAMPGIPAIYFHSLVGSKNFAEGVKETGMNRTINREKLDYEQLRSELQSPSSIRSQVFSALAALLIRRKNQRAFHPYGSFDFPEFGNGVFAITREYQKQKVLCLFNFKNEASSIQLPQGTYKDIISDRTVQDSIRLDGYGFQWLEIP